MKNNRKISTFAVLFPFLILVDQAAKHIIRSSGGFYICNPDISFGIKLNPAIFWITWIMIILATSYAFLNSETNSKLVNFGYIFILASAVSNIIDRLRIGCIIDFIDLKFWPVFNLADSFIFIGCTLVVLYYFRKDRVS